MAVLERRLADLLGKPAAAMFPSGVMAQQSMLRVWCDTAGSRRVAIPALSHPLQHESDGPRLLHGFEFELLTDGPTVPQVEHLAAIHGRLGAAFLELPLRDAGYLLPSWDELVAFSRACRERGVPLHLDGARIWESAPYLGHSPAEIAGLADSVYVSLYKGLGGLSGAALAGPEDEVAQARVWRSRMGGTLFSLMPFAVAALRGLDRELPRMAEYHERAVLLAQRLAARGIRVTPQPPHATAFRIHVEREVADLDERRVVAMETEHVRALAAVVRLGHPGVVVDRARRGPRHDGVGRRRGGRPAGARLRRLSRRRYAGSRPRAPRAPRAVGAAPRTRSPPAAAAPGRGAAGRPPSPR